jgi:hypothetical protein
VNLMMMDQEGLEMNGISWRVEVGM